MMMKYSFGSRKYVKDEESLRNGYSLWNPERLNSYLTNRFFLIKQTPSFQSRETFALFSYSNGTRFNDFRFFSISPGNQELVLFILTKKNRRAKENYSL